MLPQLMHGREWNGQDLAGWWLSEKLRGWRCLWDGQRYLVRTGKALAVPQSWLEGMPDFALDGELYAGRFPSEAFLANAVARGNWRLLRFSVWDIPEQGLVFEQAQQRIAALKLPPHVELLPQIRIFSTNQAQAIMRGLCERDAEGVMLRRPASPYRAWSVGDLFKLTPNS